MKQDSCLVGRSGPNKFYPCLYNKIPPQAPVKMLSARDEDRRKHLSGSSKGLGAMNPILVKSTGFVSPRSPRTEENDLPDMYFSSSPRKHHFISGADAMDRARQEIEKGFYESANTISYRPSRPHSRTAEALVSPRRLPPIKRSSIPSLANHQNKDVSGKAHPSYTGVIPGYASVYGKSRASLVREVADPDNRRKFYVEYGGETRPQGQTTILTERGGSKVPGYSGVVPGKNSGEDYGIGVSFGSLTDQTSKNHPHYQSQHQPQAPFDSSPKVSRRDSFHNYPIMKKASQENVLEA